jgi:GTP:adenosylcobinamide-phosphate guanylyltransferase
MDALAEGAGCRHKALIPVAGVPMLVRVVRVLRAARDIGRILVIVDDHAALDEIPELRTLIGGGAVSLTPCGRSPSASVLGTIERLPDAGPVLVTTADHALLTVEMVDYFCAAARRTDADVLVATVTASLLRERYPESKRTIIRLRGEGFSGANLFAFLTDRAPAVAAFWSRAEGLRKRPWRLAALFGLTNLLLFALRRLDLDDALARASRRIGARVKAVQMPFAECAIDVDKPDDLALASRILARRQPGLGAA